ncbi:MAG: AEC family transporter, partial [Dorea sp.]|nr:AEC family transporter [Dorea sp.]
YMIVGGIIKKLHIVEVPTFKALNVVIFKVFIPLALFFDVLEADLESVIQPKFFVYCCMSIIVLFIVLYVIVSRIIENPKDQSAIIQGIYRSNYVLLGVAIASSLYGTEGAGLTAALASIAVPIINILAVILFETKRGGEIHFKQLIINIFKNPIVDAGLLGIVFSILNIHIPELLYLPLDKLGSIATPLALVSLGGILSFDSLVSHRLYLVVVTVMRLIVVPIIFLTIGITVFGFKGAPVVTMLALFASPTAVASAPMAQTMGSNGELAGEIVICTTALSMFTLFMFIFVLNFMGII